MDEEVTVLIIPPSNHIGKHCQPKELIQEEQENGEIVITGVKGEAFTPDADGTSMAWAEHTHHIFSGSTAIPALIACLGKQRTVRKSHKLALFEVQDIIDCGAKFGKEIHVIHDPQPGYDCHSLIVGIPANTADLLDLIAAECIAMEAMLG